MGSSLIGGLIANGHPSRLIAAADPLSDRRGKVAELYGIEVYEDNAGAMAGAEVVVLAVKPQVMGPTVQQLRGEIAGHRPLVISIAAGIRIAAISNWLQSDAPVVRVMPNTPALIKAGAAALYANEAVTPAQRELAEAIMRSVGVAIWLDDESLMDAVTAVSGSGPAYFFLIMEVIEKTAVELGLTAEQARLLTSETALGAAKMVMESEQDAAALRRQVTSPGGTTERALQVLTEGNIAQLFHDALTAAHRRSIDLSDEFGKV